MARGVGAAVRGPRMHGRRRGGGARDARRAAGGSGANAREPRRRGPRAARHGCRRSRRPRAWALRRMTVELHHRSDGRSDAPVLVLGSSLGTTGAMWDENVPALSTRFRLLRYDTRGHGGSPVPGGPYTIDELGADALALLDRLGLERVAFCG